jgi:uncharacterized membrane protein YkvA (DUF1232 family)
VEGDAMTENDSGSVVKAQRNIHGQLPPVVRIFLSAAFLIGAIVYTISPIDVIPDILGPLGWVDDIFVWVLAVVVDMKLLLKQGIESGKELDAEIKKHDGFFSEDVNDKRQP